MRTRIFIIKFLLFGLILSAQQNHLDVEGHVKIRGKIDMNHADDTTSVIVGRNAGLMSDFVSTQLANTIIGSRAGVMNISGERNSFFGYEAGYESTGERNSFFGHSAGSRNTTGSWNSFYGTSAGIFNETGSSNSYFGTNSGLFNVSGYDNSFFGMESGYENRTGSENSYVGYRAGYEVSRGTRNTFVGAYSGTNADSLDLAIAIGYGAEVDCHRCAVIGGISTDAVNVGIGLRNPAVRLDVNDIIRVGGNTWPTAGKGVELAYHESSHTGFIQVYDRGLASWGKLYLGNGDVGIGTLNPNDALDVVGDIDATGCIQVDDMGMLGGNCLSDRRLKKDIIDLEDQLDLILSLSPKRYTWIEESRGIKNEIGLIAQDVEAVVPEMIINDKDGMKRIRFDVSLQIRLIKGLQEQQQTIVSQQKEIDDLKEDVAQLKRMFQTELVRE